VGEKVDVLCEKCLHRPVGREQSILTSAFAVQVVPTGVALDGKQGTIRHATSRGPATGYKRPVIRVDRPVDRICLWHAPTNIYPGFPQPVYHPRHERNGFAAGAEGSNMKVRRLADLDDSERLAFLDRDAGVAAIEDDVAGIVKRVRADGDAALRAFAREFDGIHVETIDVTDRAQAAVDEVEEDVLAAIQDAAGNIRAFHERQTPDDWRDSFGDRELGRRFRPVESAGVYVPGGTAAYPSSALMGVIPAVVAGVRDVAVATPPAEEINPVTLAAIAEAGADRVYAMGGAQAVAALAYGTETVDPVSTVVGPGNRWVTAAKAAVRGDVAIDFLAGPSEVLVVADETANGSYVAADLLAQAEHDPAASVVAVTDDPDLADTIVEEVARQIDGRDREGVIREALSHAASGVLVADSMTEAIRFAEAYAPEHLSIQAQNDEAILAGIDSAGSAFLGPHTPVAAGDYASGTNHVLPTNGGARIAGGLSVDTFLRASTIQRLDREALSGLRETITTLADAEGLEAHARSVHRRFEDDT
jgi:histidinol dehydrogenase